MKIFKVERTDKWSYDDYDSFVCFANSEDEARWTAPDPEYHMWKDGVYCYSYREQEPVSAGHSWTKDPKSLTVEYLGDNDTGTVIPSVILASFNPG